MMKPFFILILLTCVLEISAQADRKFIREGNEEFNQGRFQQAEIEYRKALEKDPQSYKADFNLGNALYKQKQYEAATTRYSALAEKEKVPESLNRYFYNLGNALFENQKYQESVEAYKQALRNNPGDMDAKHNLQLALKMLKQQQSQQNEDRQNKDQQDRQQQNKDQQNKANNEDQQERNQQQEQNSKDQQEKQDQQNPKGQISPEDAERILQALENDEKNVMKKIQEQKKHLRAVPLEKNW